MDDAVFLGGPELGPPRSVPLRDAADREFEVKDLEASAIDGDALLLVGSHSRKRFRPGKDHPADRCPLSPGRLSLLNGRVGPGQIAWGPPVVFDYCAFSGTPTAKMRKRGQGCAQADQSVLGSLGGCLSGLFVPELGADPLATAVCRSIVRTARDAHTGADACARTLNIEGAATVREEGAGRVWLGLRAPVLDEGAVLLRLRDPIGAVRELRFDGVAVLKLPQGRGVRGLAEDGDDLLVLHGPVLDSDAAFSLGSFPTGALQPGARVEVTARLDDLPPGTEGLGVLGEEWVFVVDGDEGDDPGRCAEPARALLRPRHNGG